MKMTVAQLRYKEVIKLAKYREADPSAETIREAGRLMNSFYRLSGLDDRLLYLSNSERSCNSRYTKELEDKAYKWWKRLSNEFNSFCGFKLEYFGHLPTITDGNHNQTISAFYY